MPITSGVFTLPGKHALLNHQLAYTVVLIDTMETPVERPQKNSAGTILARKRATP